MLNMLAPACMIPYNTYCWNTAYSSPPLKPCVYMESACMRRFAR